MTTAAEDGVPRAAWLAADQAFESSPATGDELHAALMAADPHIRLDELELLVEKATSAMADVPPWTPWRRWGPRAALRLLIRRREELAPSA